MMKMYLSPEAKRLLLVGGGLLLALIVLGSIIGAVVGLVIYIIKGIVGAVVGLLGFAFKSVFNLLLVGGLAYLAYRWYRSHRLRGAQRRMICGSESATEPEAGVYKHDYFDREPERRRRW